MVLLPNYKARPGDSTTYSGATGGSDRNHPNVCIVFTDRYAGETDKIVYTCAHEVGHILGISTRNAGKADLALRGHDLGPAPFNRYQYDDATKTQLLYYTRILPGGGDIKTFIDHSHFAGCVPVMEGGIKWKKWIRHEDWLQSNTTAASYHP